MVRNHSGLSINHLVNRGVICENGCDPMGACEGG